VLELMGHGHNRVLSSHRSIGFTGHPHRRSDEDAEDVPTVLPASPTDAVRRYARRKQLGQITIEDLDFA
jgi:hypothetical protein